MTAYGYARVSAIDHDLSIQKRALLAAGRDMVRVEKASGTRRDGRIELQVLLAFLQPGRRPGRHPHSIGSPPAVLSSGAFSGHHAHCFTPSSTRSTESAIAL
jgi:resolvase-like protein